MANYKITNIGEIVNKFIKYSPTLYKRYQKAIASLGSSSVLLHTRETDPDDGPNLYCPYFAQFTDGTLRTTFFYESGSMTIRFDGERGNMPRVRCDEYDLNGYTYESLNLVCLDDLYVDFNKYKLTVRFHRVTYSNPNTIFTPVTEDCEMTHTRISRTTSSTLDTVVYEITAGTFVRLRIPANPGDSIKVDLSTLSEEGNIESIDDNTISPTDPAATIVDDKYYYNNPSEAWQKLYEPTISFNRTQEQKISFGTIYYIRDIESNLQVDIYWTPKVRYTVGVNSTGLINIVNGLEHYHSGDIRYDLGAIILNPERRGTYRCSWKYQQEIFLGVQLMMRITTVNNQPHNEKDDYKELIIERYVNGEKLDNDITIDIGSVNTLEYTEPYETRADLLAASKAQGYNFFNTADLFEGLSKFPITVENGKVKLNKYTISFRLKPRLKIRESSITVIGALGTPSITNVTMNDHSLGNIGLTPLGPSRWKTVLQITEDMLTFATEPPLDTLFFNINIGPLENTTTGATVTGMYFGLTPTTTGTNSYVEGVANYSLTYPSANWQYGINMYFVIQSNIIIDITVIRNDSDIRVIDMNDGSTELTFSGNTCTYNTLPSNPNQISFEFFMNSTVAEGEYTYKYTGTVNGETVIQQEGPYSNSHISILWFNIPANGSKVLNIEVTHQNQPKTVTVTFTMPTGWSSTTGTWPQLYKLYYRLNGSYPFMEESAFSLNDSGLVRTYSANLPADATGARLVFKPNNSAGILNSYNCVTTVTTGGSTSTTSNSGTLTSSTTYTYCPNSWLYVTLLGNSTNITFAVTFDANTSYYVTLLVTTNLFLRIQKQDGSTWNEVPFTINLPQDISIGYTSNPSLSLRVYPNTSAVETGHTITDYNPRYSLYKVSSGGTETPISGSQDVPVFTTDTSEYTNVYILSSLFLGLSAGEKLKIKFLSDTVEDPVPLLYVILKCDASMNDKNLRINFDGTYKPNTTNPAIATTTAFNWYVLDDGRLVYQTAYTLRQNALFQYMLPKMTLGMNANAFAGGHVTIFVSYSSSLPTVGNSALTFSDTEGNYNSVYDSTLNNGSAVPNFSSEQAQAFSIAGITSTTHSINQITAWVVEVNMISPVYDTYRVREYTWKTQIPGPTKLAPGSGTTIPDGYINTMQDTMVRIELNLAGATNVSAEIDLNQYNRWSGYPNPEEVVDNIFKNYFEVYDVRTWNGSDFSDNPHSTAGYPYYKGGIAANTSHVIYLRITHDFNISRFPGQEGQYNIKFSVNAFTSVPPTNWICLASDSTWPDENRRGNKMVYPVLYRYHRLDPGDSEPRDHFKRLSLDIYKNYFFGVIAPTQRTVKINYAMNVSELDTFSYNVYSADLRKSCTEQIGDGYGNYFTEEWDWIPLSTDNIMRIYKTTSTFGWDDDINWTNYFEIISVVQGGDGSSYDECYYTLTFKMVNDNSQYYDYELLPRFLQKTSDDSLDSLQSGSQYKIELLLYSKVITLSIHTEPTFYGIFCQDTMLEELYQLGGDHGGYFKYLYFALTAFGYGPWVTSSTFLDDTYVYNIEMQPNGYGGATPMGGLSVGTMPSYDEWPVTDESMANPHRKDTTNGNLITTKNQDWSQTINGLRYWTASGGGWGACSDGQKYDIVFGGRADLADPIQWNINLYDLQPGWDNFFQRHLKFYRDCHTYYVFDVLYDSYGNPTPESQLGRFNYAFFCILTFS